MTETELRAAYAEAIGRPAERVIRLPGGAGNRTYWRLVERDGRSAVVMELPPEPGKSFELWLISERLPRPRSLGVIGGSDFTARPVRVAESYATNILGNRQNPAR